ncbi:MAG: hypothetical protein LM590_01515 [Thermofilum sp.]|nr:hypothetical protein [Thermofilum sp.]
MPRISQKARALAILSGVLVVFWFSLIGLIMLADLMAKEIQGSILRSVVGILLLGLWVLLIAFITELLRKKIAS